MADILELKRRLADRAQAVAEMLLPNGRREGAEWCAGSVRGEKGDSLRVHLTGAKAGIWSDFAVTGQGGDLLDLWCAVKGMPLGEAMEAAGGFLGLSRQHPSREVKPPYTRPARPSGACRPKARVLDYLREDRNVSREAIDLYKIAESGDRIVFPFLLPDGTLALVKTREAKDGAAPKPTEANCEPILFGWQAIEPSAREVIITEGEIDALSMASYGFPALSVPFGGGGGRKQQNWIENDYERMERFERIYLALDMDEVGEQAAVEIANRLGRHRCYRVKLPRKDANQCLVDGISSDEIAKCLKSAQTLDPDGLKRVEGFADKVVRLFWPISGDHVGYSLPYSGVHDKLLFRPGEMTLWSGSSGSGKSQIISDCIPKWIQEGSRVCVASFEMQPHWTLKRLVKQTGGTDRPAEPFIREVLAYLDGGLLLYEKVGKAGVDVILEIFDYARAKYGCDQFVIDSLMRLGIASDDYTGQEQAVFKIVDWTIANSVHTHLVAHSRKGEKDRGAPETEDIKGAMEIGANAFNILTIWRNRQHEDAVRAAKTDDERKQLDETAGVILNVAKQRNGDFEGRVKLWFCQENYQYYSASDNRRWARNYLRVNEPKEQAA